MGKVDLNFKGVGEVPPDDTYLLEIRKAEIVQTKDGKSLRFQIQMFLVEEPSPEFVEYPVYESSITLNPSQAWKAQEFLEAFTGAEWRDDEMSITTDAPEESELPVGNIIYPDLVGRQAYAVCVQNEFGGRKSLRPTSYISRQAAMQGLSSNGSGAVQTL